MRSVTDFAEASFFNKIDDVQEVKFTVEYAAVRMAEANLGLRLQVDSASQELVCGAGMVYTSTLPKRVKRGNKIKIKP